jgi:hypothetical protein
MRVKDCDGEFLPHGILEQILRPLSSLMPCDHRCVFAAPHIEQRMAVGALSACGTIQKSVHQ